jgi:hypothetical protein
MMLNRKLTTDRGLHHPAVQRGHFGKHEGGRGTSAQCQRKPWAAILAVAGPGKLKLRVRSGHNVARLGGAGAFGDFRLSPGSHDRDLAPNPANAEVGGRGGSPHAGGHGVR